MVIVMKKRRIYAICMVLCLALSMLLPVSRLTVHAEEVIATVQGKVLSGTTDELLKLSTSDGLMEIKLDSGTDTSNCKILLPDTKIKVSVSHGSDAYMHVLTISG